MRLISNEWDYYDPIAKSYPPEPPLYLRKRVELGDKEIKLVRDIAPAFLDAYKEMPRIRNTNILVDRIIVAFCGKLYGMFRFEVYSEYDDELDITSHGYVVATSDITRVPGVQPNCKGKLQHWWTNDYIPTPKGWEAWKAKWQSVKLPDEIFRTLKTPVFSYLERSGHPLLVKDPVLADLRFATIVNPYTAFQELDMFLGNNMAEQIDKEVIIPDKLKIQSHGFDKYSFRKGKS